MQMFKGGAVDLFTKRYAEENRHGGRVITDMSFKMYVSCFARITAYFYVISRTITIEWDLLRRNELDLFSDFLAWITLQPISRLICLFF